MCRFQFVTIFLIHTNFNLTKIPTDGGFGTGHSFSLSSSSTKSENLEFSFERQEDEMNLLLALRFIQLSLMD